MAVLKRKAPEGFPFGGQIKPQLTFSEGGSMTIVRLYTGEDGKSHFQDIEPEFHPSDGGWPLDGDAVIQAEDGILLRRFDPIDPIPGI